VSHARRGRALEDLVELVLSVYEARGAAVVRRVPDPWKVVRRPGKAAEAYPAKKGLVDYLGVWRGAALAFDCKETAGRFEFGKIPEHQLQFLSGWERCGGLAGFLVWFSRRGLLVLDGFPVRGRVCRGAVLGRSRRPLGVGRRRGQCRGGVGA